MDILEKMDLVINDMSTNAMEYNDAKKEGEDNDTMDIDDIDLMGPEDLVDMDDMFYTNGNTDDGERPYKIKPDKIQTKFTSKFDAILNKAKNRK
jgi:hypothetical protein